MLIKRIVLNLFNTIVLLIIISSTTIGQGKLFIIGGGIRSEQLMSRMLDEAGVHTNGYAMILPMASEDPDSSSLYTIKEFNRHGVTNVKVLSIRNNEPLSSEQYDSIQNAKLIYIPGGDQNRFMNALKNTQVGESLQKAFSHGAMIAGTSAGAAVMSEKMITGNELKHTKYQETSGSIEAGNVELAKGLGLLKTVIIDQHFIQRSRHNRLLSVIIENPDCAGIGIDESTGILIQGRQVEVVGDAQVLVYRSTKTIKQAKDGKLGARNIRLDIYLPGEKFLIP